MHVILGVNLTEIDKKTSRKKHSCGELTFRRARLRDKVSTGRSPDCGQGEC